MALVAAAGLVALYASLGGGRYEPRAVADPCASRDTGARDGTAATLERILLHTVDGAACKLGVSREELVLSLRDRQSFEDLAARSGFSQASAESTLAASLAEGIDRAERAGDLPGFVAGALRGLVERTPPWLLIDLFDRLQALLT